MQVHLIVMITSVLIMSLGVTPAFAQSDNSNGFAFAKPDFVFQITNIIEDIRLGLATGQDKIDLIKEFAHDKQTRIDEALSRGETVSLAVEERRNELVNKAYSEPSDISVANKIKAELNQVAELNEIRILYSQFDECITSCTELEKQEFNDKVNSLDAWQSKCSGTFDIDQYSYTPSSFDDLTMKCPDLKNYSANHLKSLVIGKP